MNKAEQFGATYLPTPSAHKTRRVRNQHSCSAINAHTATNAINALNGREG
jgi:hypothetical protein